MYKVKLNSEIMCSEKRGCKGKGAKAEAHDDSKIYRNVGKVIKLLKLENGDGPESPAQYRHNHTGGVQSTDESTNESKKF
jgi:hypothetical protein